MTQSFFSPLFAEGSLLCETHKRERKFYVERLRLVQFREARRCAAVRGAHCGVMANRNFLTRHRPIKRKVRKCKHGPQMWPCHKNYNMSKATFLQQSCRLRTLPFCLVNNSKFEGRNLLKMARLFLHTLFSSSIWLWIASVLLTVDRLA